MKESLEIVLKKYNNHIHSTTKYTPNQIFYSDNEDLFKKVISNIKMSFKNIGKEPINFKDNKKCLMNKKFKIKKVGNKNKVGILIYDKFKNKSLYGKINVIIIWKKCSNYQIKIGKDYEDMNLHKDDLYIVDYKLLNKCSENLWMNFIEKDKKMKKIY